MPNLRALPGLIASIVLIAGSLTTAQMKTGEAMENYHEALGLPTDAASVAYRLVLLESNAPGNIFWPDDKPKMTFQIENTDDKPIKTDGHVEVLAFGTQGIAGDIWKPRVVRVGDPIQQIAVKINLPEKGSWKNLTIEPAIPQTRGGYALIVDLGKHGRKLLTTAVRTFAASPKRVRFPSQALDSMKPEVLQRMDIRAIRKGVSFVPPDSDSPHARAKAARFEEELKELHEHNVTVLAEVGAGPAEMPLGRARPHLDDRGFMLGGKMDYTWLPSEDEQYRAFVKDLASRYGWPKGPITGFMLWNEPWEGRSISGWQADMPRYRTLYRIMAEAVNEANREAGVQVLVGGCDSSTNTWDKLFPDGTDDFLPYLDFCSIHYQGLSSPANYLYWRNREHPNGRVKIFDTESWVANTDDRYAGVVATNHAAGYDRAMGVFFGNITTQLSHGRTEHVDIRTEGGSERREKLLRAWPLAAAIGAVQHFIGDRPFKEVLFRPGLPWVYVFDGLDRQRGDGTVVVVGDIGSLFNHDIALYRTVRSVTEAREEAELAEQLAGIDDPAQHAEIEKQIAAYQPFEGAKITIDAEGGRFALYDFYGNPIETKNGQIEIPLDNRGYFLRARDGEAASFNALLEAIRDSSVEGVEPLEIIAHDMTSATHDGAILRLTVTNMLTRPVKGDLHLDVEGLEHPPTVAVDLQPHETKELRVTVKGEQPSDNTFPFTATFHGENGGFAFHREAMHVNVIEKRTIEVDGDLGDWRGVPPQTVTTDEAASRTLTETAWLPFEDFEPDEATGFATGYLAWDEKYFYFAARIVDATDDGGTLRFATRDDEQFYYPEVSYDLDADKTVAVEQQPRHPRSPIGFSGPGGGEHPKFWHQMAKETHINLKLPTDKATRVAVALGGRNFEVRAFDLLSGKKLDQRRRLRDVRKPTYAVYELSGDVQLQFRGQAGRDTGVYGMLFDPTSKAAEATAASYVGSDQDTGADWRSAYGTAGHMLPGVEARLPEGVEVEFVNDVVRKEYHWPEAVRRFSYRRGPILPAGNRSPEFDNVQIAFNVLPADKQGPTSTLTRLPGRPEGFIPYACTDYQYALNRVADEHGGGFEVWRLQSPELPKKHFYPRQPKHPAEGPVSGARLVTRYVNGLRITEAAIPWRELPDVRACLDRGEHIKFTFRVNHDERIGTMELARGRSVSRRSGHAFHVDWAEHWANEVEFRFVR